MSRTEILIVTSGPFARDEAIRLLKSEWPDIAILGERGLLLSGTPTALFILEAFLAQRGVHVTAEAVQPLGTVNH